MTPRKIVTFRLDEDLLDGLQAVWERDGVSVPEQVRRAVQAWLESRGALADSSERPRLPFRVISLEELWQVFIDELEANYRANSAGDVVVPYGFADGPTGKRFADLSEAEVTKLADVGVGLQRTTEFLWSCWREVTKRKAGRKRASTRKRP